MRPSNKMWRALGLVAVLTLLAGCTQEYLARQDGVTANAGDAMAADRVTMMVDPWPRASADKNIAFNGERMQSAIERYRTNKVIPPTIDGTSSDFQPQQAPQAAAPSAAPAPVGPTVTH
jgi:hypothetical protein